MKALGALAMVVVALMLALSFAGGAKADSSSTHVRYYDVQLNGELGYGIGDVYKGNPGPTLYGLDNETMVITFHSTDQYSHATYFDLNNDTLLEQGEPITNFYISGYPAAFSIPAGTASPGSYVYRDYTNATWYGTVVVQKHPEPWFKWDPFFIFGLMMGIALVGFVAYILFQGLRIARNRRRIKATNPGIVKWLKVVMDPESPTRPTQGYVDHIRVEKKRRRKAEAAGMRQRRDNDNNPPKPPSNGGNDGLNLG